MRRFLICLALLLVTLLISRSLGASAAPGSWEWGSSFDRQESKERSAGSIHVNLDLESEDLGRATDRRRAGRRSRTYPRGYDGTVRFRLEDRNYDHVALEGSFLDGDDEPMHLDERKGFWEVEVPLAPGRHQYAFVTEDEGGSRRRTDPSHSQRAKRADGRWVSQIEVDAAGRVLPPDLDSHDRYELDIAQSLTVSYQRVDGLVLGTQPTFESNQPLAPVVRGWLGYGFASSRWSGQLTMLQPLRTDQGLRLILSGYDRTDFTNQTSVGSAENSLASWIFREDSRDYYEREGVSWGMAVDRGDDRRLTVLFRADRYRSLSNEARASWGWGRDRFLPNPAIGEGVLRSVVASLRLGDALRHFAVDVEIADDDLATTTAEFTQITAQYRTRLRMGRWQTLDLRLKGGTNLRGHLPVQKRYLLGGLGTVRGVGYQSLLIADPDRPADAPAPFGGERMVLFNAEYAFGVVDEAQLVLLFDSGMAWEAKDARIRLDELESSVGLGIQSDDGGLRLDFVKGLDGTGDILVQARIERPF